jgi:phenylacetate-coenzyme A ligase PaaK-like adenylate-forming protein
MYKKDLQDCYPDKLFVESKREERAEGKLKNLLNVGVEIELVGPGSLPRFEGKAKRAVTGGYIDEDRSRTVPHQATVDLFGEPTR